MSKLTQLRRNPKRFVKETKNWIGVTSGSLLYLLPTLLIFGTIKAFASGNLAGILVNAGAYAAYIVAGRMLRRGLQAEIEYHDRRVALAPKWPLKNLAAIVTAATTFLLAWLGAHNSLGVSMAFGAGAFLGMGLCYGFDPRGQKMAGGTHGFTVEEIANTIASAEKVILSIEQANHRIRNPEFNNRIDRICDTARQILDDLQQNPAAIRRTRKFLLVYLESTGKITTGYADTHLQADIPELEQNFRTLLDSIENVFNEQKDKLLQEDLFDLDVQMEVLAKQLKHEGIV